ncbi:MAG TPA: outer membrane lipoprotein chaperone LolA [Longimicrobiaceae bacterium]|nr:outer membrane lipoprotein chaperone LolA [Longimicrobiaceae bacterium]
MSRSEPASHDAAPAADPPVPAAAAPAAAPSDADAILRRASAAYDRVRSLEASFSQTLTVPLLDQTQHGHGKLYIRRPDHLLMKFSQPAGDVIDVDGKYAWIYYPSSDPKQVIRTDVANGAAQVDFQKQFLTNPTARFDATVTGTATVDGRSAWALTLVPKGESSYKRIRVWVDKRDALVRRFEITQENDSVRRIELSGLKINPTLPDSLFRFTPPPGAEIFQQ